MRRIIFTIPASTKLYKTNAKIERAKANGEITTQKQEDGAVALKKLLRRHFGSNYFIMPGTKESGGRIVVDALPRHDSFDPDDLAPSWQVLGIWEWDGKSETATVIQEINASAWNGYLSDVLHKDPKKWAGWPPTLEL